MLSLGLSTYLVVALVFGTAVGLALAGFATVMMLTTWWFFPRLRIHERVTEPRR